MLAATEPVVVKIPIGDLVFLGLMVGGTVRLLQHLWMASRRGVFSDPNVAVPPPIFPPRLPAADALIMTLAGAVLVYLAYNFVALAAHSVLAMFFRPVPRVIGGAVGLAGGLAPQSTTAIVIATDIGRLLGGCCGVLLLARWLTPSGGAAVGWDRTRAAGAVRVGLDAMFSVLPVCVGLAVLSSQLFETRRHPVLQQLAAQPPALDVILLVFTAVVAAPVSEEFFFRGLIQSGLREAFARLRPAPAPASPVPAFPVSPTTPPTPAGADGNPAARSDAILLDAPRPVPPGARWSAIILTSALFAGIHLGQQPQSFGTLFALSAAMGIAFERTGNLAAPITVHVVFNALNVIAQFLMSAK